MASSSHNTFERVDDESFDDYFDQYFDQTMENLAINYGDQEVEINRRKKPFEEMNRKKMNREEQPFYVKIRGEKYFFISSSLFEEKKGTYCRPRVTSLTKN